MGSSAICTDSASPRETFSYSGVVKPWSCCGSSTNPLLLHLRVVVRDLTQYLCAKTPRISACEKHGSLDVLPVFPPREPANMFDWTERLQCGM